MGKRTTPSPVPKVGGKEHKSRNGLNNTSHPPTLASNPRLRSTVPAQMRGAPMPNGMQHIQCGPHNRSLTTLPTKRGFQGFKLAATWPSFVFTSPPCYSYTQFNSFQFGKHKDYEGLSRNRMNQRMNQLSTKNREHQP